MFFRTRNLLTFLHSFTSCSYLQIVGGRSKISPQQPQPHGHGAGHCCGCGSGNSYFFVASSQQEHVKNAHGPESSRCRNQQNQCNRPEEVDFYVCDCYTCRSTAASMEVCCQCCNCTNMEATNQNLSPRYHVSSVMLKGESDDTLEVCLRRQDEDEIDEVEDDIALAHAVAEANRQHQSYNNHHDHRNLNQQQTPPHCNECSNCCGGGRRPPGFQSCPGRKAAVSGQSRRPAQQPQQYNHGHSHNLPNPHPHHSSHRMLNNKHKKLSSTRHSCTKGNNKDKDRKKIILLGLYLRGPQLCVRFRPACRPLEEFSS